MQTLKIYWLNCCDSCNDNEFSYVRTQDGSEEYLWSGDKAECSNCGHKGIIDADGDNAWVEWDEVQEEKQ